MKIFAFLTEPANYTLDLISHIYQSRRVRFTFMLGHSTASTQSQCEQSLTSMSFVGRLKTVWRVLREHDALVINGYTGKIPRLVLWLNLLFFRKPMAIESDTELQISHNKFKRCLKWVWLHFLFTRPYCYGFAGGNYGHKALFRHYGMKEERICLAPMVVDNKKYFQVETSTDDKKVFRFGYLGRLIELKQVDKMIAAIRSLHACGYVVDFWIIGDGEERASLEDQAKDLPITFKGMLFGDEKIQALHALDCLILYSSYESWGLVVNEALASGIPVIVSDKVGARYDLVEGDAPTGLVASSTNLEDLIAQMKTMVEDVQCYYQFKQNALLRMKQWDYAFYGKQFDQWIEKVSK